MLKITPKITLVGAGPGDPELLTIKGWKALQTADVVLYDALSNDELLDIAPEKSIKIFVGKRAGNHHYRQEEINLLIVQNALLYGHVVRLKGGDAFVFGRGHEELEFAKSFDIETTVVPGISSSIAAAELQSVPLTRRGINESFWVMTATTSAGQLSDDIHLAAQSSATIVILMGIRKLAKIAQVFQEMGKEKTPVMLIQSASCTNEKKVLGTIDNIVSKAAAAQIGTPGIIIIGEVVKLHPELNYAYIQKQINRK